MKNLVTVFVAVALVAIAFFPGSALGWPWTPKPHPAPLPAVCTPAVAVPAPCATVAPLPAVCAPACAGCGQSATESHRTPLRTLLKDAGKAVLHPLARIRERVHARRETCSGGC